MLLCTMNHYLLLHDVNVALFYVPLFSYCPTIWCCNAFMLHYIMLYYVVQHYLMSHYFNLRLSDIVLVAVLRVLVALIISLPFNAAMF